MFTIIILLLEKAGVKMEFAVIGISYKEADAQVRDKIAFVDTKKLDMYNAFLEIEVKQAVIVSTCNRSEIYFIYEQKKQIQQMIDIYMDYTSKEVAPYIFQKQGIDALQYVYEVCGGYHSLVLGEDQILGQMQQAYQFASQANACGKGMHKIFQNCFACVKHIKSEFRISEYPISIAYLAMKHVKWQMDVKGKNILVIGSGEMAKLLITYLIEEEPAHVYICGRSMEHAASLLLEEYMEFVPLEKRYTYMAECDVIFSATASPHMLIEKEKMGIPTKEQLFMDIASPRDIDPSIQEIPNVKVMDIDSLQRRSDEHREKRRQLLEEAHVVLLEAVQKMDEWLKKSHVDEAIHSLQERSEQIAEDTYMLLEGKLELNIHEKYILKKVLHASFFRMVKEPMIALKNIKEEDQQQYLDMIAHLFKGEA